MIDCYNIVPSNTNFHHNNSSTKEIPINFNYIILYIRTFSTRILA